MDGVEPLMLTAGREHLAKLAKFFLGSSQLLEDFAVKSASNFGAGMNWYRRGPAIRMLPTGVAAFLARAREAELLGGAHQLLGLSRHARS